MFIEEILLWAKSQLTEVVRLGMIVFCVERKRYSAPNVEGWTRDVMIVSLGSEDYWATISMYEDGSCDIEYTRYQNGQSELVSYEHYQFQSIKELRERLDCFVMDFLRLAGRNE